MSLTDKTIANSYKDLLQVDNSKNGITTTVKQIKDGDGTGSVLGLCDDHIVIQPQTDDNTTALRVRTKGGTDVLVADTTNNLVTASGNYVNTQYATFSVGHTQSAGFLANTHYALPFGQGMYGSVTSAELPVFGTGTDPALLLTTAEADSNRASEIVPCMWYVMDDISIDNVRALVGADTATGDTTRMHLFSYDFTSANTSCLTNGALVAHEADRTNLGSEQVHGADTWTIDSAAVSAGKVILAFFRSDSINSDYSIQLTVKYHLT